MSWNRSRLAALTAGLLILLAGCVALPPISSAPTGPIAVAQATDIPANDCPEPDRNTIMSGNPSAGYCLLFPRDYSVPEPDGTETAYYFGSLMDVSKPKLFVRVEDANGQSAAEIASALVAEVEAAGLKDQVKRTSGVTLGGEVAERLDNMPGQDLGRVLITVHGPRAYRLTFVPADPTDTVMFQQTEALYDLVLRSFRFMN
jgi:hypothetical protein